MTQDFHDIIVILSTITRLNNLWIIYVAAFKWGILAVSDICAMHLIFTNLHYPKYCKYEV